MLEGTQEIKKGSHEITKGIAETNEGIEVITDEIKQVNKEIEYYYQKIDKINSILNTIANIIRGEDNELLNPLLEKLEEYLYETEKLVEGLEEISQGLEELEEGTKKINQNIKKLIEGQEKLIQEYQELIIGLKNMKNALNEIKTGLDEINLGLNMLQDYILEISNQKENVLAGFFVPEQIYKEDFPSAWNDYGTPNKKVTMFHIISDTNPYEERSMEIVDEIEQVATFTLKNTPYENSQIAVDGLPSNNRDLKNLSSEDFLKTSIFMLIGIFIVLSVLFKSFIMPIYALISLGVTYIASQAVVEFYFYKHPWLSRYNVVGTFLCFCYVNVTRGRLLNIFNVKIQ
nr:MMPL family transporter [Candidatus Syntrophocurvum alkaliphilum]